MNFAKTLIISAVISFAIGLAMLNLPAKYFSFNYWFASQKFGTALTTISSTDTLSNFPTTYNANIALTANTSAANSFTALNQFANASSSLFSCYGPCYFGGSATSSFSTSGALTLITPLTVANGGTGSTTLSSNQLLLGNGTGDVKTVSGWGTTDQVLSSTGGSVAPVWRTFTTGALGVASTTPTVGLTVGATTTTANLNVASSTISINGATMRFPSTLGASSTLMSSNGTNAVLWVQRDWELLGENSITGAATSTLNVTIPAASSLRIEAFATSTTNIVALRFNNDAGNNYDSRNNSSDVNQAGNSGAISYLRPSGNSTTSPTFYNIEVLNLTGTYKLWTSNAVQLSGGKGAADNPVIIFSGGLWANNAVQITNVQLLDSGGSTMGAGTRLRVWGMRD